MVVGRAETTSHEEAAKSYNPKEEYYRRLEAQGHSAPMQQFSGPA
ncbi:MAG: hypothetical protein AAFP84_10935 [Actinomycetota bacterium]